MENERASVGRHLAQRRRRRPTVLLAAACILLILALGIGGGWGFFHPPPPPPAAPCVDAQVRGIDSSEATAALSKGWDEASQGPTPDVWVPASSAWALQVRLRQQASKQAALTPLEYPKVATSPMVMAVPKPMAETLGWPRSTL